MTDTAKFTYTGPDQEVRVGGETFRRHMLTTVSDAEVIAEVRKLDDFTEVNAPDVTVQPAKPLVTPAPTPPSVTATSGPASA